MSDRLGHSSQSNRFPNRSIFKSSLSLGAFFLLGTTQHVQAKEKTIVAVEPLVCDVVKAIAPPSKNVTCLIDRKKDVHDLKFSPKQAQALKKARQVITLGPEMTPAIRKWANNPSTVVVGISALEIDDHERHGEKHSAEKHGDHEHHFHGDLDPHIWHDPNNIIKMSKIISKSIRKNISIFDKKAIRDLRERSQSVESILEDLDRWTQKQVSTIPSQQRTIVSKHKAMEYYGDAFGLKTLGLLGFTGHSSSLRPQNISSILKELKETRPKVLFSEQKPASKLLRNLSRQSSIPISSKQIYVDGLMPTGNTISVAINNTCNIVNSLGGSCDMGAGVNLEEKWALLSNY